MTETDTRAETAPAVSLTHRVPPVHTAVANVRPRLMVVVGLAALVLAGLAAWDDGSILLEVDRPVSEWIADQRTDSATDTFNLLSRFGDNIIVFALAGICAVIAWWRCRWFAVAILLSALVRPGMEFVLKATIDRERPDISPLGEFAGPSHPSGHPMAAAAFWGLIPAFVALMVAWRWAWRIAVVVAPAIIVGVAAARVYKGAHYLTDVIASLLWASLYLIAVQLVFDRLHRSRECRHSQRETQLETTDAHA